MTEVDALGAWVPTETDDIKDSELWSLDATLTDYILPRIKAFRRMKRQGYPVLEKDIKTNSDSSADDERFEADWENILFDIEKGFEAHKKIGDVDFLIHEEAAEETMQKGLKLFAEHYGHLWD
jgi:hypothetical protein